jgi:hypothetical protein
MDAPSDDDPEIQTLLSKIPSKRREFLERIRKQERARLERLHQEARDEVTCGGA